MPDFLPLKRWSFWKDAFWRPAGALVGIPYALWGLLAFVRDEIIQPKDVTRWKPIYWASKLPWHVWLIATLAIALIVVFEGAYRVARKRETELLAALEHRLLEREAARPRVKVSAGLVDVRNEPRSHLWIMKFTATNYGEAVAINVFCDIPIRDTQRSMSFSFSELRRDDPQTFTPKLFHERKPWQTSDWAPLDTFLKDARLEAFISRQFAAAERLQNGAEARRDVDLQAQSDGLAVQVGAAMDLPIGPELSVRFDVTYTDMERRLLYRSPHILTYRPVQSQPAYDGFESAARIDLVNEPEPAPTPLALDGVRGA